MNESDVADFLLTNPDFFARHAELLGHIRLGNPHGKRAISLPERQIELLRDKNRQYERRLGELVRYGHENDSLAAKFDRWSTLLAAEKDVANLPNLINTSLSEVFDVPQVAVRLWDTHTSFPGVGTIHIADGEIERLTNGMAAPYCGPNTGFAAASWLQVSASGVGNTSQALAIVADEPIVPSRVSSDSDVAASAASALGSNTASIALIPLRSPHALTGADSMGLLVLGSPDIERFHAKMGTDFLIRIGRLAGASLSRLSRSTP